MNPSDIKATARKWYEKLGMGFHPDTKGHDYVLALNGHVQALTAAECRLYDRDMELCFMYCAQLKWDFYEVCLDLMTEDVNGRT
jgi:hypothetical protein